MNHHALNGDDGSYLPQEYLHLVANDVTANKKPRCDFRSPLMKTVVSKRSVVNAIRMGFSFSFIKPEFSKIRTGMSTSLSEVTAHLPRSNRTIRRVLYKKKVIQL